MKIVIGIKAKEGSTDTMVIKYMGAGLTWVDINWRFKIIFDQISLVHMKTDV